MTVSERPRIDNARARRAWLAMAAWDGGFNKGSVLQCSRAALDALGMVQLDPIRTVARAHDHILWSRVPGYRPRLFERLIAERHAFEHFSHDAVLLPMHYWPVWRRQLSRRADSYARSVFGKSLPPASVRTAILSRIRQEGPLCSRDFQGKADRSKHAWMKPPHKLALDWLWLSGELAVADRRGFAKRYDLVERVVPAALLDTHLNDAECVDRLHRDALQRTGIVTATELQRFWDATSRAETDAWLDAHRDELIDVDVQAHDGSLSKAWAPADIEARIDALPSPARRVRILNPFDPTIRDRRRTSRLFGFDYTIEIYVPAAKRRFGYYVYPVLDGDRLVGRIDIVRRPTPDRLRVLAYWPEPGVHASAGRRVRLDAELRRLARLADVADIDDRALDATLPPG